MACIAGSGDLTKRADIGQQDEIGRMADAFNTLMAQLQKIIGEVDGASRHVATASEQLAGSFHALALVSGQQSNAVANSAAAKAAAERDSLMTQSAALAAEVAEQEAKLKTAQAEHDKLTKALDKIKSQFKIE